MKKYIAAGALLVVIIATVVIVIHLRKNRHEQTQLEKFKQLEDSAAFYRQKKISDSINLIESSKKLAGYEQDLDTLKKDMRDDSFAMDVRRSVLRARIEADHRAQLVRDSIGRLRTGSGSH